LEKSIIDDLNMRQLIDDEITGKIEILAGEYRNRAAHAAIFDYDRAEEARKLSLEVLQVF
jgi:hypothetical protein